MADDKRKVIQELLVSLRDDKTEHVVDLSHGQVTDEDIVRMAVFIPRNISMERLLCGHCALTSKAGQALASALATRHSHLLELDISNNTIRAEGLLAISEAFEWNTSVEILNLKRNELTNDGDTVEAIVALGRALEKNDGLTYLDISDNNLTDFLGKMEGIAALSAALPRNQCLQTLNMASNVIGPAGAQIMSDCIISNNTLTSLDLSDNHFGTEGAKSIASLLARGSLNAIQSVNLAHNDLCGKYGQVDETAVIALAGALRGHTTLTELNLIDNQVNRAVGLAFVEALRFNTSLTSLGLGGGDPILGDDGIMDSIRQCTASNLCIKNITDGNTDVDATDNKRRTALHHAVLAHSVAGVEKLIDDLEADINVVDAKRYTPLRQAVELRYAPCIGALLSREANIDIADRFGDSPLHQAVRDGDGALATVLLDQGASTTTLNNRGLRPLDVTRSQHLRELLVKHAARRPVWLICGHDKLELEFGKRMAHELWERGGLNSWLGGGEGREEDGVGRGEWRKDRRKNTTSATTTSKKGALSSPPAQNKRESSDQSFAGYEGPPGKLMEDMIGHCAVAVYIAGPYANRSPACLRELMVASEKSVPIVTALYSSGMFPRSVEQYLYKTVSFNFSEVTGALSESRAEAAWSNLAPNFVEKMNEYEDSFRKELPLKMIPMIGSDADHFALHQVDGKCFVFMSHGGMHAEYATQARHELEQYRLWCFVDNNKAGAEKEKLELGLEGLRKCMVFCPILSDRSIRSPLLVEQIKEAENLGKPIFPIVLSLLKLPPILQSPCTLMTRKAIVSHILPSTDGQFSGIGPVGFRGNFDQLAISIQSQIAMGELYGDAGVHTGEGVSHGESFGGVAKSGGRYRQLQERIRGQEAALVAADNKIKELTEALERANSQHELSTRVVEELKVALEVATTSKSNVAEVKQESVEDEGLATD
jgi:Ran GTPase-activating protein (RanGAP) involved in mRNA processing and transport